MAREPDALRGDLERRELVETAAAAWEASPSPGVDRKRLHRVGPAESGQVTSIVRYAPGSRFPEHDHPDGEEILVLGGVFSDEDGDWGPGSYLLRPEGFAHAPHSSPGCTLFVKLRQHAGPGRERVLLDTAALAWKSGAGPGIEEKALYLDARYGDEARLERWSAGTSPGVRSYAGGAEILVLEGGFEDEDGRYGHGAWLRLPDAGRHAPRSREGCTLYLKTGGVAGLRRPGESD